MSAGKVKLKNVSSGKEVIYIKELNKTISFGEEYAVTDDFTFSDIAKADSLAAAINGDKILIIQNGITLSKADSLLYAASSSHTCGESNTASNVGTGAGWFKQKVLEDLEFKKINSTELTIAENASDLTLGVGPVAISGKASVTPASGMEVLLNDSGTLKKGDIATFLGGTVENQFVNNSLINPTNGAYNSASSATSLNKLWGVVYSIDNQITIDGCTIEKGTAGSGNLATAIYKYDSAANNYAKVANTNISSWNTGTTGLQTISITSTILSQGIYLNVLIADTASTGTHSGYTMTYPYSPLGMNTSVASYQGLYKSSYTYVDTLPATLAADSSFWTFSTGYYNKFASFLLNQV